MSVVSKFATWLIEKIKENRRAEPANLESDREIVRVLDMKRLNYFMVERTWIIDLLVAVDPMIIQETRNPRSNPSSAGSSSILMVVEFLLGSMAGVRGISQFEFN